MAAGDRLGSMDLEPSDHEALWTSVDEFVESHVAAHDSTAARVLAAQRAAGLPDIAVSSVEARLLTVLARSVGAKVIVEIGTLGGFSTLHLARALPGDGRLVTLERDPHHADVARASLDAAGVGHKVTIRVGEALDLLPTLADDAPVDLVFIDADKQSNVTYYEAALAITRPGGLVVVDNVVRQGQIADPHNDNPSIVGSRAVIERAGADPRVEATVIQTVGRKGHDGMLIASVL